MAYLIGLHLKSNALDHIDQISKVGDKNSTQINSKKEIKEVDSIGLESSHKTDKKVTAGFTLKKQETTKLDGSSVSKEKKKKKSMCSIL